MMNSKLLARAAVAEPGWWQLEGKETDFIDLDKLRAHVTAAIDAAVLDERERCAQECDKEAARWRKASKAEEPGSRAFIEFASFMLEAKMLASVIRSSS